jgi:hypothetical protein
MFLAELLGLRADQHLALPDYISLEDDQLALYAAFHNGLGRAERQGG